MSSYVSLSPADLALASVLILVNAGVSMAFRLGLERTLLLTTLRMVVQLLLIGLVLRWIFQQTSPLWTLLLASIMIAAAGREAITRQERRIAGWSSYGLGTGTLLMVGTFATIFAVGGVISPDPWYAPRYVLPILGMVLGNSLTGIALSLDTLTSTAWRERAAIEARLALGQPRLMALRETTRRALKTGMTPILNAMAASGIVSLPGMMTGQILAGVDPVEATKYQVLIMFLIAGSTALGVLLATFGGVLLITDDRHRLRLDRLVTKEKAPAG
ncbi:MAG: iron export ABC transporter permease subunit FetB [Hyphomicrobiaceae bacterium]|nr:iron export ABC transporter permease subunit FetB [Hyphomicrobiaceae bacterium]